MERVLAKQILDAMDQLEEKHPNDRELGAAVRRVVRDVRKKGEEIKAEGDN